MRINYDVVRDGLAAINTAASQLAAAQQQVSTGQRVSVSSDDPLAAAQGIGEIGTMAGIDAYTRSRDAASARLSATDNVLSGMVDKISAAIVTATSVRGTTADAQARAAAADTIRGLSQSLLSDVNTTFNGTYLFSGTAADQVPYAQSGGTWTYQGNTSTTQVEVENGRLVSISFNGQQIVQGTDSQDLFTTLDDLANAIESGDNTAIGQASDALNNAYQRTLTAQGRLGIDEKELTDATGRLAALRTASETRRSSLLDANLAEAITKLTAADTSYRAALGAVSSVERQSLLDYLK
jgi:flagellar hook-associated protein 3 FlgL